jgi:hypothetical protein
MVPNLLESLHCILLHTPWLHLPFATVFLLASDIWNWIKYLRKWRWKIWRHFINDLVASCQRLPWLLHLYQ